MVGTARECPGTFRASVFTAEAIMLVLTRKLNQEIVIGDDIRITVVAVGNDQVKLGITAPRCIPVHRSEIYRERQSLVLAGSGGENSDN